MEHFCLDDETIGEMEQKMAAYEGEKSLEERSRLPSGKTGLIFPGSDGGLMNPPEFDREWIRYCKSIGMTERRERETGRKQKNGNPIIERYDAAIITPHQFRHAFATLLYDSGVDVKAASGQMGHAKTEVTQDIYIEISRKKLSDTREKMDSYYGERFGG